MAVAEKSRAFEEWLQRRDSFTYDRYQEQRVVVKRGIQVAKRMADWRWRERFGNDFKGIIIIYHDFLPTPRRGSHVKSDKTHTQSSRYTP